MCGYVILSFTSLFPDVSQIRLNCRQSTIRRVTVNNVEAKYAYDDPLTPIVPPSARKTAHHHDEYRQQYIYALQEADEGELVIDIPEEFKSPEIQSRDTAQTDSRDNIMLLPIMETTVNLRSVSIRIDYSLCNPKTGIYFVLPETVKSLESYPHMFTHNQASSARLWMPCIDRQQEQCAWTIDIVTPRTLQDALGTYFETGAVDEIDPQTGRREGTRDMIVVCSGQLEEEIIHPTEADKKISRYSVSKPVGASSILFAVGPFHAIPIPGWMSKEVQDEEDAHGLNDLGDDDGPDDPVLLRDEDAVDGAFAFCLPGREEQVEYTVHFVAQALAFFEQILGAPFPHSSYKQVFLEDVYNPVTAGATMAILSTHLLINPSVVDQTYETIRLLCRTLAAQWFGHYLIPKAWADAWLMVGLTNYFVGLFLQRSLGKNEYKFRLQKDMQRVCELDVNQPPIYPTATDDIPTAEHPTMIDPLILQHFHPDDDWASVRSEFISLKSPIVLYMLDRRMGKGMLRKVVNKLLQAAASGELPNGLSTHHFLRVARKMTGKLELKIFADQWIYGSGCPRFNFKYTFNRKKMVVEFRFWQENTNGWIVGSTAKFTGPFMIRIHEPGGTYDTEIHIEDGEKQYDIQYHTKYKRIRRKPVPPVKSKKGSDDLLTVEETSARDVNAEDLNDSKMEWNDEEPNRLDFEWIRLDPDNDWLCVKVFEQSDYMWAAQLRKDKNVNAQIEAIGGLHQLPSQGTCSVLHSFLTDRTAYYGLRMEAASALARCASDLGGDTAEKYLTKPYREKYCCDDGDSYVYPKSHDFADLQEYFSMVTAMSMVRHTDGIAPTACRRLLLNLLKFNDNTGNIFSDSYFIANLIVGLGNSFLPNTGRAKKRTAVKPFRSTHDGEVEEFAFGGESDDEAYPSISGLTGTTKPIILFEEALAEVHRYRVLDRLIPSYHNSVTIACLEVLLKWMVANLLPVDLTLFLQHARYGNFLRIRLVAIDALFMMDGLSHPEIARVLLDLIADDPVPYVKYHVAKALAEFVEVLAAENTSTLERNEAMSEEHTSRVITRWNQIRQQIAGREAISQSRMESSDKALDHRVRFNLLRFCEYLYEPAPEQNQGSNGAPAPRLKIKMPQRRVVDDSASEDEGPALPLPKRILLKDSGAKIATSRARPDDVRGRIARQSSNPPESTREPDPEFRATCAAALTRLVNHPSSASFILPVDAAIKDYYQVIQRPMDLHTAGLNVQAGIYADDFERFLGDVRQIFKNCYEYNLEESNVYRQAKKLEQFFETAVVPEAEKSIREYAVAKSKSTKGDAVGETVNEVAVASSLPGSTSSTGGQCSGCESASTCRSEPFHNARSDYVQIFNVNERALPLQKALEDATNELIWKLVPRSYPVALGIPNYFQVIKKAMDLQTIKKKLDTGAYHATKQFEADVRLMLSNSLKFNPPDTPVHKDTRSLLALFEQEWNGTPHQSREGSPAITANVVRIKQEDPRPVPTKHPVQNGMSAHEVSQCERALAAMNASTAYAGPFLNPVSKELYPIYHELIKEPMDLSTIGKKLQNGKYRTGSQFADDVKLMFSNCYTFNREGEPVYTQGKRLEAIFDQHWRREATPLKAQKPSSNNSSPVVSSLSSSKAPRKGGEKTTPSAAASASQLSTGRVAARFNAADQKTCARILKRIQGHPSAGPFLTPVDPVALGIPQYLEIIKRPMDISTIQKKLQQERYGTPEEFREDFQLMLNNCFKFNLPGDWVYGQGKALENEFDKEWKAFQSQMRNRSTKPPATPIASTTKSERPSSDIGAHRIVASSSKTAVTTLNEAQQRRIVLAIRKMQQFEHASIFLEPVNPREIPDYYTKIKKPMDLRMMEQKAQRLQYSTYSEFEGDMKQMFANCFAYNPKTSFGHGCGLASEKYFNKEWKSLMDAPESSILQDEGGTKKRKRAADQQDAIATDGGEDTKRKKQPTDDPPRKKGKDDAHSESVVQAKPLVKLKLKMKK
ncbi:hypothetical protein DFJ77DRAFT_511868 [Powellomyces hirtus]|nr:hypothetical protein DFJ77DRAFT_511868 [Powellomyces hirtus]